MLIKSNVSNLLLDIILDKLIFIPLNLIFFLNELQSLDCFVYVV